MNQYLKTIQDLLQQNGQLTEQDREALLKAIIDADKQWNITDFKLDRTEKVKKTTAILLEETIAELEKKRKAIEDQNHELEIEGSLERVRSVAMGMKRPEDMLDVCKTIARQLELLKVKEIRNVQTGIFYESKGTYTNYEFYAKHDKVFITEVEYKNHPVAEKFANQMLKGPNEVFIHGFSGDEVRTWLDYQKTTNVFIDTYLETAESLTYYWYSLGPVAMGISTYIPLSEDEINLFKRFRNVFELAYRRYLDIEKAEAQAREAKIEAALEKIRSRSLAMHHANEMKDVITVLREKLKELGIAMESRTVLILTLRKDSKDFTQWVARPEDLSGKSTSDCFETPYFDHPIIKDFWNTKENGLNFFSKVYTPEQKLSFFKYLFENTESRKTSEEEKKWILTPGDYAVTAAVENSSAIIISNFSNKLLSEKESEILRRFARVFEQAYIRFLDLQRADAQAKESQIQLALERVRARTMAMHQSDELRQVVKLLYDQLEQLGFSNRAANIVLMKPDTGDMHWWMSGFGRDEFPDSYFVKYFNSPALNKMLHCWRSGDRFASIQLTGESKKKFDQVFLFESDFRRVPEEIRRQLVALDSVVFSQAYMKYGALSVGHEAISDEQADILERFAIVFEQTYTRFLDLQKAEAQAKEAQIEAALEKVRSRSLAMHKSDEIGEVVQSVFDRLNELNIELNTAIIIIFEQGSKNTVWWLVNKVHQQYSRVNITYADYPFFRDLFDARENDRELISARYSTEEKNELFNYFFKYTDFSHTPEKQRKFILESKGFMVAAGLTKNIAIHVTRYSENPFSRSDGEVLKRVAKVFDQAYTRFLDLQKAEAQALEAKIEASLEKVRSSAMAMHNSNDISSTTTVVFNELKRLEIESIRCGVALLSKDSSLAHVYAAASSDYGQLKTLQRTIEMTDHPSLKAQYDSWLQQKNYFTELKGEELKSYQQLPLFSLAPSYVPSKDFDQGEFGYYIPFTEGLFYAWTKKPYAENEINILTRFKTIIDLTFRRYLDLQKAEARAREAKIEAAMEKVRARAMAMQKPAELVEVAQLLRTEMGLLGVEELETSSIYIQDEINGTTECWYAIQDVRDGEKRLVADHMTINLGDTWVGREMMKFYKADQKQISIPMKGENRKEWINYCSQHSKLLQGYYGETIPERTYHLLKFSNGYMGAASPGDISAESWELLKRATNVFSLAYTRFNDLQLAESNAREAVKQSVLDRIRADIASMRTVSDLDRITPLIWNELTILGVPFIRCGVFIMDNLQQLIHTFLSTPDGKAIGAFHLPYDTPGNFGQIVSNWNERKMYVDHWEESDFISLADLLVKQGAITSREQYLNALPHEGIYLHFLPFLQGMLYVGNTDRLADDEIKLIQSVADAFSTAYARYEDFNKLEAAKQQVEKTLEDLRQAQTQLVQSEKMASLGELTAGIAHEIQNPLNFVNNFSDLNNELIEELKSQKSKLKNEEQDEILNDIFQNNEKILFHGKRADAIVKGMLQHSRISSGQKELTDINLLVDEYLRLAYHGLRAKDKSFNARFESDFDKSLDRINIIPQDIGRVILNLINNAFYSVNEKRKRNKVSGYEPTVRVATKREYGRVDIKVRDNGNGIPQKILDKIFQPFFTTKPTGQGTGLGLSLSYDIIKAHGGEITVDTKEGEGSEFIISIPAM